jgi:hypothetical protein
MSTLISYQKAYFTKGTSFPGNLATLRFPVTGRIGPVTFVTVGSRNQAFIMSFFLKGLRFITPKAFSELLKLSREYQMLTVTKVTDFRWTRSQRVQSNSVTSLRLQKRSPTLIGIGLQANRAESLPFVSIRVASLL